MDYWEVAGRAIEDLVADEHPEDSENWAAIVPMSDDKGWGLDLARWSTEARIIIENFGALIGSEISVPKTAIVVAGNKALDEFQAYLAAKAEHADARAAILRTKTIIAEWRK